MAYASRLYPRAKPRGFTLQWIISINSGRIQFRPYPDQKSKIKNQKSKIKNQKSKNVTSPVSNEYSAPTTISLPFSINCSSTAEP